jgi:hypothetical protein
VLKGRPPPLLPLVPLQTPNIKVAFIPPTTSCSAKIAYHASSHGNVTNNTTFSFLSGTSTKQHEEQSPKTETSVKPIA